MTGLGGKIAGTTFSSDSVFDTTHAIDRARNLAEQGKFKDALHVLDLTIELRPSMDNARLNRGLIRQHVGMHKEAVEDFDAVAFYRDSHNKMSPHAKQAIVARGVSHLALGNMWAGFIDWSDRPGLGEPPKCLLWDGVKDISDKSILVVGEFSLSENLLLSRWLKLVEKHAAFVTLVVPPEQQHLFSCMSKVCLSSVPATDYYVNLRDLPIIFEPNVIPAPSRFGLPIEGIINWQAPISHRKRVGLYWADVNVHIPLKTFKPLLENPRLESFSLLKSIPAQDKWLYDKWPIWAMGEKVKTNLDMACALKALDVVITVDSYVAHLAATLGIATFVVLPCYRIDWPWGVARSDCAFYPTVRTFRQTTPGQWDAVIDEIGRAIADFQQTR